MEKRGPMLFSALKGYTRKQFAQDAVAGVIVAIIALPLSIALALASGVGPEEGLYTAIVAGFVISFLGGSSVQIAGPTAAFATVVAGVVARSGMEGLMLATVMAGVLLVVMGLLKLGSLIRFIPYTITTGFTAGIAVTICIGQLKDFFGVSYAAGVKPVETMEKLQAFFASAGTVNLQAVLVGLICLAILIVWPRVSRRIPGSLVAVLAGIALVKLLSLNVNTIGDLYTVSSRLPSPRLPHFDVSLVRAVLPDAFTIAVLAAIESLLSCVVADGMTGTKHRSNTELIAQGAGNIASALFGGIPATGAIARTAANVKNGGRTPVAGMVHALVLLLILVVLMPYAALIPMPAIAAILFMVAYNMCQWRPFYRLVRTAPKSDVAVLVATFALTVLFDLVVAIEVGMVMACVLFVKRMSDETSVQGWVYPEEKEGSLRSVPRGVRVYESTGPLFFGAASRIGDIAVMDDTRCLVLRMRGVTALDSTALGALEVLRAQLAEKQIAFILSHVNEQPMSVMRKAGFAARLGVEGFCPNIEAALRRAEQLARGDGGERGA